MPIAIIEFDTAKDPQASAKFVKWQQEQKAKREQEARFLTDLPAAPQRQQRDALVLNELAAGRFMLHQATCSHLTHSAAQNMANARKIAMRSGPSSGSTSATPRGVPRSSIA